MHPTLTKQQFYDVFLCCLHWQSDPEVPKSCCTTVDKVARILHGLGLIDEKQKKNLSKDKALQQLFWKNLGLGVGDLSETLSSSKKEIWISVGTARALDEDRFNLQKLLRNERIYLTARGRKMVLLDIELRYREVITAEQYLTEIERQKEYFQELDESARLAILKNYRLRVEKDTS